MGSLIFIALLLGATAGWMALLMLVFTWPDPQTPDLGPERSAALEAFLAHFLLFGVLGVLVSYDVTYLKGRHRALLALAGAAVVGAVWGGVTELTQMLVPERDASFTDMLTDVLGAITAGAATVGACRLARFPAYRG